MLLNLLNVGRGRGRHSGIAGWAALGFCLFLLLAATDRGACFDPDTEVTLALDFYAIYRDGWEAGVGRRMPGTISVSKPGTQPKNEIKLQGRRDGPLWQGEDYWVMDMVKIEMKSGQTSILYIFNFGPPCDQPDDATSWEQYYKYTATIQAGQQYKSNSKTLTVINEWDGSMGYVVNETL